MIIKQLARKVKAFVREAITPPRCKWKIEDLVADNMNWFEVKRGYRFDLDHPVSFTEKLQRYKLFYTNDALRNIVDKANFKQYVADRLGEGHTIPLLGVWDNIGALKKSWGRLPESFVLKSTICGNGKNIKIIRNKSETNAAAVLKEVKKWLNPKNTNLNGFLRGYYDCRPRILAEEYMENVAGQLFDYKVFCFDGEPYCFYVATEHFAGVLSHISFYDLDWNRLNVRYGEHENCDLPKPEHFDEMLACAKKLSAGFPFVRVDFFDVPERLYLAEMTFYPGSGLTEYVPNSFDLELGKRFSFPELTPSGT